MIRPHVLIDYGDDVILDIKSFYLADQTLKIVKGLRLTFTRRKAAEFYSAHEGKFYFENLLDTTTAGESAVFLIEGPDAIKKVRKINGHTDSRLAEEGTIRAKYGIKAPPGEMDPGSRNAVHSSDSSENANREEKIIWPG